MNKPHTMENNIIHGLIKAGQLEGALQVVTHDLDNPGLSNEDRARLLRVQTGIYLAMIGDFDLLFDDLFKEIMALPANTQPGQAYVQWLKIKTNPAVPQGLFIAHMRKVAAASNNDKYIELVEALIADWFPTGNPQVTP